MYDDDNTNILHKIKLKKKKRGLALKSHAYISANHIYLKVAPNSVPTCAYSTQIIYKPVNNNHSIIQKLLVHNTSLYNFSAINYSHL